MNDDEDERARKDAIYATAHEIRRTVFSAEMAECDRLVATAEQLRAKRFDAFACAADREAAINLLVTTDRMDTAQSVASKSDAWLREMASGAALRARRRLFDEIADKSLELARQRHDEADQSRAAFVAGVNAGRGYRADGGMDGPRTARKDRNERAIMRESFEALKPQKGRKPEGN